MSLARAWRRQLYGASSVALIVPSAMLAALIVLALGGGFGQVGVLGQIFAGPPAPSAAGAAAGGGAGVVARALPAIPAAALVAGRSRPATRSIGTLPGRGSTRVVPVSSRGAGGAVAPVGGVAPIVSGPVPSRPAPTGSGSGSAPSQPSPQPGSSPEPGPSPQPTVVDQVVKVVTPVTQQLPAPAGPAVTQAVQAAGSAADGLLPPGVGSGSPSQRLKLP
ncbi:MAG TPA: hypothetical protein VFH80_26390 [Solirubrobacteraceae bacterium]|nr:hypothetical protein [Solirubrobacteraceae bacterium]